MGITIYQGRYTVAPLPPLNHKWTKMGILIEEKQRTNSVTKKLEENPKYKKQIVVLNSQFVVADQSLYDKIYEDVNTEDDNELSDRHEDTIDSKNETTNEQEEE